MRSAALIFVAAGLLIASMGVARANLILSFDPVKHHADIGDQVDVDVRISGLGNNAAPSLGAFDLDVTFNDSGLDFASLTFCDPVLGNQLDLFGFGFNPSGFAENPDPAVGLADFFEISLDAPSDLDTFQADSFILATLSFDVEALGASLLSFSSVLLSDSLGNALTATTSSAIIAVPEPATLTLFAVGLVAMGFLTRRRKVAA